MIKITDTDTTNPKILELDGEFISEDIYPFKLAILNAFDEGETSVVLDMKKVSFIDSSGIGVLVGMINSYKKTEKSIKLSNVNAYVKKSISIALSPKFFDDMH